MLNEHMILDNFALLLKAAEKTIYTMGVGRRG